MKRVLVIDDMKSIRALIRVYLMEFGFEFEEASDGKEGLARAIAQPPDLIILDFHMPSMSGNDVIREVRRTPAICEIPIVVLTSDAAQADAITALALPKTYAAKKPINLAAFQGIVRDALAIG